MLRGRVGELSGPELRELLLHVVRVDPELEVATYVSELDPALAVDQHRGGMGDTFLHLFGRQEPDSELIDRAAVGVDREAHAIAKPEAVDETPRFLVDLRLCHDPDDLEILDLLECLSQLDQPRLGEGSPIHAALEGQQHPVAT